MLDVGTIRSLPPHHPTSLAPQAVGVPCPRGPPAYVLFLFLTMGVVLFLEIVWMGVVWYRVVEVFLGCFTMSNTYKVVDSVRDLP